MLAFVVFVRNLVLAAVLAWLGLEFTPEHDEAQDPSRQNVAVSALLAR